MNPDLEHLVVLQAQDLQLKRLKHELEEAPRRVAAADAANKQTSSALASVKDLLSKEEALRRRCESDIQDRKAKIARLRKQLDTASSAAQVTAYEHEIKFAEDAISKLEDDELASMERTETLEAQQTKAVADLEHTVAALDVQRGNSAAVVERNTAAVAAVEAERKQLRAQVSESMLATYDRVAKSRGTGVSEALDHKCSACQMMVRPQRWNDLTGREHRDDIYTCETCGRLLFWDPRRDSPGEWLPGDRLAAAK